MSRRIIRWGLRGAGVCNEFALLLLRSVESGSSPTRGVHGYEMIKVLWLLVPLLICCGVAQRASATNATWPYAFAYVDYSVETPPRLPVDRQKGYDFDVYTFHVGRKASLFAYVGNQPDFPLRWPGKCTKKHAIVNGLKVDTVLYAGQSKGFSKQVLVELKQPPRPRGQYIHFYYKNLSPSDAKAADAIINSLDSPWLHMPSKATQN